MTFINAARRDRWLRARARRAMMWRFAGRVALALLLAGATFAAAHHISGAGNCAATTAISMEGMDV